MFFLTSWTIHSIHKMVLKPLASPIAEDVFFSLPAHQSTHVSVVTWYIQQSQKWINMFSALDANTKHFMGISWDTHRGSQGAPLIWSCEMTRAVYLDSIQVLIFESSLSSWAPVLGWRYDKIDAVPWLQVDIFSFHIEIKLFKRWFHAALQRRSSLPRTHTEISELKYFSVYSSSLIVMQRCLKELTARFRERASNIARQVSTCVLLPFRSSASCPDNLLERRYWCTCHGGMSKHHVSHSSLDVLTLQSRFKCLRHENVVTLPKEPGFDITISAKICRARTKKASVEIAFHEICCTRYGLGTGQDPQSQQTHTHTHMHKITCLTSCRSW